MPPTSPSAWSSIPDVLDGRLCPLDWTAPVFDDTIWERAVTVTCTSGRVKILRLKMIDRRYPFDRVGSFTCSDPLLTSLWEMAVNTIEAVSDDAYGSDARERNEWLQDTAEPNFITPRVSLSGPGAGGQKVFSDPRLLKNLLRHAALVQLPDSRLLATIRISSG